MIPETDITFGGSFLDRADHLRSDDAALNRLRNDPNNRALPFWCMKPLFDLTDDGPRLAWLSATDDLITGAPDPSSLLGVDDRGVAHFAADVSHIAPPDEHPADFVDQRTLDLSDTRKFIDLRAIMGDLQYAESGVAASAKGMFEWRATHRFCAKCGQPNAVAAAGWRMDCTICGGQHFPRTDPVVIMLILDGDNVLLGRQSFWPEQMYSLLAGFMEPGETIEDAVRRETMEEAGVPVAEVRYVVSQPWPFPSSLMIGCAGRATSTELNIDTKELEHARWATKEEVRAGLEGRSDWLAPARKGAVAQMILSAWVAGEVPGFG